MNKSLQDAIEKAKQHPNGLSDVDLEFIYQQGREDALMPIPIEEYDFENVSVHDNKQLIAFDEFGQTFIPMGLIRLTTENETVKVYDHKSYKEFLQGKTTRMPFGEEVVFQPREVKWFIELPYIGKIGETLKEQIGEKNESR